MTRADLTLAIGLILAVAVPAGALHFTAPASRLDAGLTAAPFGWPRLLIAHLVTALPLGVLIALTLRKLLTESLGSTWILAGSGLAALATQASPEVGLLLSDGSFGPVAALVGRGLFALLLVLPWCVAALGTPPDMTLPARPGVAFLLAAGFALAPCGLYSDALITTKTQQVTESLGRERLKRAEVILSGLCELGSDTPVLDQPPLTVLAALRVTLPKLEQAADQPFPDEALPEARLSRALLLMRIERWDEAARQLEPLTPANLTATLLLATVRRDQGHYRASDELFAQVAGRLRESAANDPGARGRFQTAVEGLVFNAHADHRPADALRWLEVGRAALPEQAAFYDFQLGLHYQSVGRPRMAIAHLSAAVERDPTLAGRAAGPLAQLRTHTPGCFLGGGPR